VLLEALGYEAGDALVARLGWQLGHRGVIAQPGSRPDGPGEVVSFMGCHGLTFLAHSAG
jgi:hypothetical protein